MSSTQTIPCSTGLNANMSTMELGLDDPTGINRIPAMVWTGLLLVIGTVGNLHALIIYIRIYKRQMKMTDFKKKENPFVVFVLSLTALDLFTCVFILYVDIVDTSMQFTLLPETLCQIFRYLQTLFQTSSISHVTVISIHCFRKIYFKDKKQIIRTLAFKLCVGCTVIAALFSIPSAIMSGYHTQVVNGESGSVCFVSDSYNGTLGAKIYMGLMAALFGLCVIILFTSYIALIRFRVLYHQKKAPKSEKPRKTMTILIILTVIFLVSYLPFLILGLIGAANENFRKGWSVTYFAFYRIIARFPYLNNILNPFIYGCKDPEFRKILGQIYAPLLRKCKCSKK